jgi:hypothetical protein
MDGMPRTARSLGALLAAAAVLAVLLWVAVRTLVGPGVPVGSAAVELGAPAEVTEVEADEAPRRVPSTTEPRDRTPGEAPQQLPAADDVRPPATDAGAGAGTDLLVVSPPPVPLPMVAGVVHTRPAPSVSPPTTAVASPAAPAESPAPPALPPIADPPPAPPAPAEEPSTSRPLTVADDGCAMPEQAGHGLGRAAAKADSAPPPGQHRRGCSVPEPAERPQAAATLPAPAAARAQDDPDGPGRGGGAPGGAGRGRGPKG